MKIGRLREQPAYRIHVPRWSYAPTSGAGAAQHGGRLNRVGVPALYLALDEATALAEYRQLSVLMPPGVLVSYVLDVAKVIDFAHGYNAQWDVLWQELGCDWRRIWFNERVEPPSWLLGDLAVAEGAAGIVYPSLANPQGTSLVIYPDALGNDDQLDAYDPDGRLPRNQESWR